MTGGPERDGMIGVAAIRVAAVNRSHPWFRYHCERHNE
jgi:hypothetical protein